MLAPAFSCATALTNFQADDEGSIPFTRSNSGSGQHVGRRPNRSYLTRVTSDILDPRPSKGSRSKREQLHGETEIRTHEAALQRWDDWSRGPRQDDADGCADEGIGGQGLDAELCEL